MQLRRLGLDLVRIAPGLAAMALLLAAPADAQDEESGEEQAQEQEDAGEDEEPEEGEDRYARPGAYLQALFTNNIGGYAFPAPFDDDAEYATGFGGALGYRIQEYVAAEVFGDFVTGWPLRSGSFDFGELVAGTIGVNAKGYLGGGRFQPYGLFGLAAFYADQQASDTPLLNLSWDMAARLGVGADWYVNDELGVTAAAMYVRPFGIGTALGEGMEHFEYVSIAFGAFLRFGGE